MTDHADSVAVAGLPRARQMLARARWAARAFGTYDRASVLRIADAVTRVAEDRAQHYAQWAVQETGAGVVADRLVTHRLCSRGVLDAHRDRDHVTPRVDHDRRIVELPRPVGVVLVLPPWSSPVSTVYAAVILSMLTRNAVVVSPHPAALECCADAARALGQAAVAAGAPDGVVQVIGSPSPSVTDELVTDVVLASGGPANVPVLIDATADLSRAAAELVASKAFDGSLPCTSESVLVVEEEVADALLREMARHGAHVLDAAERDRVRDVLFPGGRFDSDLVGRDAAAVASRAGVQIAPGTRILVAPFDRVVDEELLAHGKPCPVLGVVRVPGVRRGIRAAAGVLRIGGDGHSAVIHSDDPRTVMDFAAALDVVRVTVNQGGTSTQDLCLPDWLRPERLVSSTRIAHGSEELPSFEGIVPWSAPTGPVPAYPVASNLLDPPEGSNR